jgi:hypothetical protein
MKVLVAGDRGYIRTVLDLRWRVQDGIDQLVRAYTERGMTYGDFTSSRFVRLRRIRDLLSAGLLDDMLHRETVGHCPSAGRRDRARGPLMMLPGSG